MKEEIYQQFCKEFRLKLKEITDPVAPTNNRSFNALCDVISNVILLEINMDKMPFEQVPKREVRLPSGKEAGKIVLLQLSKKELAQELLERLKEDVSLINCSAEGLRNETIQAMGLYSSLKNYITSRQPTDH